MNRSQDQPPISGRFFQIMMWIVVVIGIFSVIVLLGRMGMFSRSTPPANIISSPSQLPVPIKDFRFGNGVVVAPAGSAITFTFSNDDFVAHSFDVDALDIHVTIGAKQSNSWTFTVAEPGDYEIYCAIPGHTEAGMVGVLQIRGE